MKNYFFYVSHPIINQLIDFNNVNHINLIKWILENKAENTGYIVSAGHEYTKAKTDKARRLLKKAGLTVDGKTGECGKHFIDISFRKGEYKDVQQNFDNKTFEWIYVEELKEYIK